MLLRIAIIAIAAITMTGCKTKKVWNKADMTTAATLEHSSDFRMETIDGSWVRKPGFNVQFGGSRWFLNPGHHGITFFYDNGRTYTTNSVLLTHQFESKKKYQLVVHDKDPVSGEMRFIIKPKD